MSYRIAMLGAGSFFTDAITHGLCREPIFKGSTFVLVDTDPRRLKLSLARNRKHVEKAGYDLHLEATTDRREALPGCDYVVTSCEKRRAEYWARDIEIPRQFGIHCLLGENGGPGGQAHAMRNITMFMDICADLRELCPDAWLMNFTNPMSFVCTYFERHGGVKALGFCHQVHGSFGVVAEMLGFEPGDLQVITGGINHFNWLLDIRRRGTGRSFMPEFRERVLASEWWAKIHPRVPEQVLTREIFETFGEYPVGYDSHIAEYLPFFYDAREQQALGYEDHAANLRKHAEKQARIAAGTSEEQEAAESQARSEFYNVPFPKDGDHPWYRESPTEVMHALETNTPLYLDALVTTNHGAIDNLPADAIVDVPGIVVGGEARSVHVGPLPAFGAELCRRQIAIHELLVEATVEGNRTKVMQSMALDPYVRSIRQARDLTEAFLKEYREELPQFWT